ncbi:PglL family O-oligosaccharyltransferase [Vibrio rotiferianus]|uniref:PglL family O-oligosaccharyltransferase n=1 Tax=Vibrio rotiferianus TaxID=190895 RepID=UPI0011106C96|nr:PglL family O-oligosaccharyltransferase [Vibrio rotiferianus]NOH68515.1 ligase [Vibrio rotiferianus]TMX56164.1 ligase [Vibrio rotiferianus]
MATIHVSGTKLSPNRVKAPLNRKFLISLTVVFLLAMHIFMPNPGGSGLALSFNATTWIGLSISLGIGLYHLATNREVRYSKLTIGLLFSGVIISIPVLFPNANIEHSANQLIGLWTGLILFVVLQQFKFSNKHKQRLLWFIVLAVLIESLFGFIQFLVLQPGNIFGYDTVANRPYGIFQQPNVMASFLVTGLAIAGYLLARQPYKYERKLSDIIVLYLVPILTIPLVIVLASRTGWLSCIFVLLLLIPYLFRFTTKKRLVCWLFSILIGLMIGTTLAIVKNESGNRLSQKATASDDIRSTLYKQGLDMLIEKPFTGYGYGNFEPSYILYTARQHALNENYPSGLPALDHPHNELLYWGIEGGLLPIIGITLAAGLVLFRIYHAKRGTRLAILALFIPILMHSQLEYPFYHSFIHWMIFVILLYWVDQRVSRYRKVHFSKITKSLLRVCSIVIPAAISFYMLSALHTNYVLTKFETTRPTNPDILNQVTNPVVWKDRFDWDVYSTFLNIGLYKQDPTLIQPYIDWSLEIIKDKPRPAFYNNLILAYQGLDDTSKAEQIRAEAQFLFPKIDFSGVNYQPPSQAISASPTPTSSAEQ